MGHETNVGLVDAHSESDGRDHDDPVLPNEPALVLLASLTIQPRVIRQGVDALARQEVRNLIDGRARQAIDDAGVPIVLAPDELEKLLSGVDLVGDPIPDVGSVEARDERPSIAQMQALDDLLAGRCVGGRR